MWVCFTRNCCVSLQKARNLWNENEIINPCIAAHLLLFNPDILYAHIMYMLRKTLLRVAQKTYVTPKREAYVYCCTEKEYIMTKNNSC